MLTDINLFYFWDVSNLSSLFISIHLFLMIRILISLRVLNDNNFYNHIEILYVLKMSTY